MKILLALLNESLINSLLMSRNQKIKLADIKYQNHPDVARIRIYLLHQVEIMKKSVYVLQIDGSVYGYV